MQGFLNAERRGTVLASLRTDEGTLSRDYLAAARSVLRELVAMPDLVRALPFERKPGGYTRNLLAGDDSVSVWAIVWAAGATTCIHDHHCSCCFGVVSGTVTETWYRAIDAQRAIATEQHDRRPVEGGQLRGRPARRGRLRHLSGSSWIKARTLDLSGKSSSSPPSEPPDAMPVQDG